MIPGKTNGVVAVTATVGYKGPLFPGPGKFPGKC